MAQLSTTKDLLKIVPTKFINPDILSLTIIGQLKP